MRDATKALPKTGCSGTVPTVYKRSVTQQLEDVIVSRAEQEEDTDTVEEEWVESESEEEPEEEEDVEKVWESDDSDTEQDIPLQPLPFQSLQPFPLQPLSFQPIEPPQPIESPQPIELPKPSQPVEVQEPPRWHKYAQRGMKRTHTIITMAVQLASSDKQAAAKKLFIGVKEVIKQKEVITSTTPPKQSLDEDEIQEHTQAIGILVSDPSAVATFDYLVEDAEEEESDSDSESDGDSDEDEDERAERKAREIQEKNARALAARKVSPDSVEAKMEAKAAKRKNRHPQTAEWVRLTFRDDNLTDVELADMKKDKQFYRVFFDLISEFLHAAEDLGDEVVFDPAAAPEETNTVTIEKSNWLDILKDTQWAEHLTVQQANTLYAAGRTAKNKPFTLGLACQMFCWLGPALLRPSSMVPPVHLIIPRLQNIIDIKKNEWNVPFEGVMSRSAAQEKLISAQARNQLVRLGQPRVDIDDHDNITHIFRQLVWSERKQTDFDHIIFFEYFKTDTQEKLIMANAVAREKYRRRGAAVEPSAQAWWKFQEPEHQDQRAGEVNKPDKDKKYTPVKATKENCLLCV